ncbi:hypothetical protein [Candidatus Methanoprimaticola sp. MG2]|uniref:hypothetical protein n=1 Tax=Candidatus Methanoprimaticola sp. MG2 TaxID=3228838 RepID=UPI0039C603F9
MEDPEIASTAAGDVKSISISERGTRSNQVRNVSVIDAFEVEDLISFVNGRISKKSFALPEIIKGE